MKLSTDNICTSGVSEISSFTPLYCEVEYSSPIETFSIFSEAPWSLLLGGDNYKIAFPEGTNRYSYIATSPFLTVSCRAGKIKVNNHSINEKVDLLSYIQKLSKQYSVNLIPDLPPFQGGILGLLSYDLCDAFEAIQLPEGPINYSGLIGFYDLLHVFDHKKLKSWVFSSGLPYKNSKNCSIHAKNRLNEYINKINSVSTPIDIPYFSKAKILLQSNFTREEYISAVTLAKEYIKNGDIFEVNLSQRFSGKLPEGLNPYLIFKKLYEVNPCPFSAFANFGSIKIISSSPERFIQVNKGNVETRPIKGTRKRGSIPYEDNMLIQELINSEKDKAENIMIVDLMRNDLSRVCEMNSVKVEALCAHEIYPKVHHLVSVIKGHLQQNNDVFDLLKNSFPGGSITGAPKIRAMEIISELEPHNRGPYCGNLIIASFDSQCLDSSILIRTYVIDGDVITFHGGGAVTIESDADSEYEETLSKISALKDTLEKFS